MPNDAKCGLVIGVGLVIAVAVVFFQKGSSSNPPAAIDPAPHTSTDEAPTAVPPPIEGGSRDRPVEARTLIRPSEPDNEADRATPAKPSGRTPAGQDSWQPVK